MSINVLCWLGHRFRDRVQSRLVSPVHGDESRMSTDSVGLQNDINMSRANVCVSGVVGGEKRINQHDRAFVLAEMNVRVSYCAV